MRKVSKCGKVGFRNYSEAQQARKDKRRIHHAVFDCYRCPTCELWHLTKANKGKQRWWARQVSV